MMAPNTASSDILFEEYTGRLMPILIESTIPRSLFEGQSKAPKPEGHIWAMTDDRATSIYFSLGTPQQYQHRYGTFLKGAYVLHGIDSRLSFTAADTQAFEEFSDPISFLEEKLKEPYFFLGVVPLTRKSMDAVERLGLELLMIGTPKYNEDIQREYRAVMYGKPK